MGKLIITNTTIGHSLLISGIAITDGRETSDDLTYVKLKTGHSFETLFPHTDTMAKKHSEPTPDSKKAKSLKKEYTDEATCPIKTME